MKELGQVFRYAIATGRAVHDITADLRGALAPVVTTNDAAVNRGRAGVLSQGARHVRAVRSTQGDARRSCAELACAVAAAP